MRQLLILLLFLSGCASNQHRHPHDHGLSAFKGQLNRIFKDNEHMFRRFQGLQINTDKVRVKNVSLEARLDAAENALLKLDILEASVTRMDKELIALLAYVSKLGSDQDKKMNELSMAVVRKSAAADRTLSQIYRIASKNLRDLRNVERVLEKLKPQPLMELKDEEDPAILMGPQLPAVGGEVGEEEAALPIEPEEEK